MHFVSGTTGSELGLTLAGGFVLMETTLLPHSQVPMHTHQNATIVQVLSGQYREKFRGVSAPHAPLSVIAKPSGEKHANDIGPKGARCLVIELTEEKMSELEDVARPCELPVVHRNGAATRTGLRIVRELRNPDALTPLALEGAALQLVVELSRYRRRTYAGEPKWMKLVLELLHEAPPGSLGLSALASTARVHPVHLARTFRRAQGCSIGEYARRLQMDRVMQMLTQTKVPLTDVALSAGFYDQSHMSRALKRETGMTASQVRAATMG